MESDGVALMAGGIKSWPSPGATKAEVAKRQWALGFVSVLDPVFGYTSGTDIGPALNAAIAAMPSAGNVLGGTVVLPPGDWTSSVTVPLKSGVCLRGMGRNATRLTYSGGGGAGHLFTWSGTLNGLVIEHLHLRSTSGHILRGTTAFYSSAIRDCHIYVSDPASSIIDHQSAVDFDNIKVERCMLMRGSAATVPGINVINSGGAANANAFQDCWMDSGGQGATAASVPFVRMYNTGAANYCNDNAFTNITGERNAAGLLDLRSHMNLTVENVVDWDSPSNYTASLVRVGKHTTGPASRNVFVRNVGTHGSTMDAAAYDVELVSGEVTDAVIVNPGRTPSGTKLSYSTTATHNITVIGAAGATHPAAVAASVGNYFSNVTQFPQGVYVGPTTTGVDAGHTINFGPDVDLSRAAANVLYTHDAFRAEGLIRASAIAGGLVDIGAVGSGGQSGVRLGTSIVVLAGNGSPEGAVTAPVGSMYLRGNATGATDVLYVKATGTGNTGWVAK